ncbi:hypothetical protein ACPV5S_15625 [Vibrio astriarenae]
MAIRYKHNYRNVIIEDDGSCHTSAVSGNNIAVLMRGGEIAMLPYAGVIDCNTPNLRRVKLVNLSAYAQGSGQDFPTWQEIRADHYCVGHYSNGYLKLVLKDGKPMTYPLPKESGKSQGNNVVRLPFSK